MLLQADQVELAADMGDLCGECPLWLADEQALLWTDITGKRAHRLDVRTGQVTRLQERFEIAGLVLHAAGGYVAVNSDGIWRWDGADGLQAAAIDPGYEVLPFNDCVADSRGRLLTGSTFFKAEGEYVLGKLYAIDLDRSVRVLEEGLHLSNGLAFSPPGTTLYVTDSVARRIYSFAYDPASGAVSNRHTLVQVSPEEGIPDGLTVDSEGFLWSAQWYGGVVIRYDPDGQEQRRFAFPAKQVSSLAFGGPDLTDLYVTSAARLEPGPVPRGYRAVGAMGGQLFRIRTETMGRIENLCMVGC